MTNGCAPVYNFYNCCCENASGSNHSTPAPSNNSLFIIRSASDQIMSDFITGDIRFASYSYPIKPPGGLLSISNNLQVMHCPFILRDLSFIKFAETGSTTKQMSVEVVVMNYSGAVLRTLTLSTLPLVCAAIETWLPFQLTTDQSARTILVGEVVMIRFTISSANNDTWQCFGNSSGLAELV